MSAQSARSVAQIDDLDKTRALQRVLYRSAKQDPTADSMLCMATSPAATFCGGRGVMWLLTLLGLQAEGQPRQQHFLLNFWCAGT